MNTTTNHDPFAPPLEEHRSGRHQVNVGHLVMGLAFAGLLLIWALNISQVVTGAELRFLMPLPWVVSGVVGLVVLTLNRRRTARRRLAAREAWLAGQDLTHPTHSTEENPS